MTKKIMSTLVLSCMAISTFAGGYQVSLQSQRNIAMGHTGVGFAHDASSIFFNPGALSLTGKRQVMAGASLIFARSQYLATAPNTYSTYNEPTMGTPFELFADYNTGESAKWKVGLGVYTPYGSKVEYANDWKGKYLLQNIDLKAICIQPTVSYSFNDKIGIGAGFVYSTGSFKLQRAINTPPMASGDAQALLEGKASGMGFNVGVFAKISDQFSAGVSYRSLVKMKTKGGTVDFTVPSALDASFPDGDVSSELPLPSVLSLGLAYKASDKLNFALDANMTGWSVYDTLAFDYETNTTSLADTKEAREYNNALAIRLGAEYSLNEKIDLRAGIAFDFTPVEQEYMTPETPDANRINPSFGIGFKPTEKFSIDASFLWVEAAKREVKNTNANFTGTYKTRALIPGLGISYSF